MTSGNRQELARLAATEARRARSSVGASPMVPIDPIQVAEKCGCQVWFKKLSSLEGLYAPEPKPTIILGSERPAGRRSYSCCHELGHHVFKHGHKIDELEAQKKVCHKPPEEYLADMFASHLLMPQIGVRKALNDRLWKSEELTPQKVYTLASYFGVGYSSIINHLRLSLCLIDGRHAESLLKVKPKEIKGSLGAGAGSELVIVDRFWQVRAVDLEVGDALVLPLGIQVDSECEIVLDANTERHNLYNAVSPGITRAYSEAEDWAVNIRVSRKGYDGLAQYRFLSDEEE